MRGIKKIPVPETIAGYYKTAIWKTRFINFYMDTENNIELLEKVCQHKKLYFKSAWADYDTAKRGSLKLIPKEAVLKVMEKDYKSMAEMFSESAPNWKEIVELIEEFELEFNKL